MCPRVHEFIPEYFSESSDDDEDGGSEIGVGQIQTGEATTDAFMSKVAKCACCQGNPKKCVGDICKSLGMCYCVAENYHDMM